MTLKPERVLSVIFASIHSSNIYSGPLGARCWDTDENKPILVQTVIIWPDYCHIFLTDLLACAGLPSRPSLPARKVKSCLNTPLFYLCRVRTKGLTMAARFPVTHLTSFLTVLSLAHSDLGTLASIPRSCTARHTPSTGPSLLAILFCLEPSSYKYLHVYSLTNFRSLCK